MPKIKKVRRTRKRCNKQRGGARYEDKPERINHSDYTRNADEEQYYYSSECYHYKLSKEDGDRHKAEAEERVARTAAASAARQRSIESDPTIVVTQAEYKHLTPAQLALGWEPTEVRTGMAKYETHYKRATPEDARRRLESTLEWQINNNPMVKLTEEQYLGLTPAQHALGWIKTSIQTGIGAHESSYRRRTAADDRLNYEKTIDYKLTLPHIFLEKREYDSLTPAQKELFNWRKESVQSSYDVSEDMWKGTKK
jgi:hypothetical protein